MHEQRADNCQQRKRRKFGHHKIVTTQLVIENRQGVGKVTVLNYFFLVIKLFQQSRTSQKVSIFHSSLCIVYVPKAVRYDKYER